MSVFNAGNLSFKFQITKIFLLKCFAILDLYKISDIFYEKNH